jgi:hypothetical protein
MKKVNYFENKQECNDFLKSIDFSIELPELEGNFDNYYVELKDNLKDVRMISMYDSGNQGFSLAHRVIFDSEV